MFVGWKASGEDAGMQRNEIKVRLGFGVKQASSKEKSEKKEPSSASSLYRGAGDKNQSRRTLDQGTSYPLHIVELSRRRQKVVQSRADFA